MKTKRIKFATREDAKKASKWAEEKYGAVFKRLAESDGKDKPLNKPLHRMETGPGDGQADER